MANIAKHFEPEGDLFPRFPSDSLQGKHSPTQAMELSAPPASPNGIAGNSAAAAWTGGGSSSERLRLFDPELAESLGQLA